MTSSRHRFCMLVFGIALYSTVATAQLNREAYGVFGHYLHALHNASFQSLPSVPCCAPSFGDGTGSSFALGVLYQLPLTPLWTMSGRLSYVSYPGTLSTDEPTTVNVQGRPVPGIIRHDLQASLASVSIEPLLGYRLTDRITLHGGASMGYVMRSTFTQTEQLIEPLQGTLTTPTAVGSGDIPDASPLHAAVMAGLTFDIPMFRGSRWFITPEAFYTYNLVPIVPDLSWSVSSVRIGVALKYSPPQFTLPDPPAEQRVHLVAGVRAVGLQTPEGTPEEIVRITVEEFLSRTHKPLLPYVFFSEGSAVLPPRYRRITTADASAFLPERFNDSTLLSVYYDMLNIIGKRMRDKPRATLTLTGCNSNSGAERSNLSLAQQRAEAVRNYLTTSWNIAADRIEVKWRNLPANPSNVTKQEGDEENRRVEIAASDPSIIEPLVTRDTLRNATPPIVRFLIEHESEAGIGSYSVAASQQRQLLQAFNSEGAPPPHIDWYLQDNPTSLPRTESAMQYDIRVTDLGAQEYTSPMQDIPVEQRTIERKLREKLGDIEIVRYTLMSFGFSQAEIDADNARYLSEIQREISSTSTVSITGSTDTMGETAFNASLSEQRARAVARYLKQRSNVARGVGEQSLHTNDLPEGRFYNRTVRVLITNPTP